MGTRPKPKDLSILKIKKRERWLKWLEKNKEHRKEYIKQWKKTNKEKVTEYRIKFKNDFPWIMTYQRIHTRIHYADKNHIRYRNMEFTITKDDLKELWFRDKAYLMKKPSIDRINNNKGYIKDNCRYLELSENCKRRNGDGENANT